MDTKEKIIVESFLLFLKKGLINVSLDEIKKEAKISTGTFYYYFKNKEDLVYHIVNKFYTKPAFQKLNKAENFKGTTKERIYYIIELTLKYKPVSSDSKKLDEKISNNYTYRDFNIFIFEVILVYDDIAKKNTLFHKQLKSLYKTIINDGIKNNEIKNLNLDIARLIYNITYTSFYSSILYNEYNTDTIKEDIENIWSLIKIDK